MTRPLNIELVPFKEDHLKKTYDGIRDPELQRDFLMRSEPSWDVHCAHFERVSADPTQLVFAITAEGHHVGNCGLKNIKVQEPSGELWIYIGEPSMRRKGIGKRAAELIILRGCREHLLEKILVHVSDFNVPARRLYESMGFIIATPPDEKEWRDHGAPILRMEWRRAPS